jgi:hypothetical protein
VSGNYGLDAEGAGYSMPVLLEAVSRPAFSGVRIPWPSATGFARRIKSASAKNLRSFRPRFDHSYGINKNHPWTEVSCTRHPLRKAENRTDKKEPLFWLCVTVGFLLHFILSPQRLSAMTHAIRLL